MSDEMMMDAGIYVGRVVSAKTTVAGTGTPQLEVECQLLNEDGSETSTIVKAILSLTEKARAAFVDGKLAEMGFNGDFKQPQFGPEVYERIELECNHDEYKGKVREKWSLGRGGARPADNDILQRLAADWRAKNAPSRPPQGRPTPPAARPAQAPASRPPMPTRQGGKSTVAIDDLSEPPF